MREPFTVRISDSSDPERADKFERILKKRGANATDVIRGLIDAYNLTDGIKAFPVILEESPPAYRTKGKIRKNSRSTRRTHR
jgi:hypothetical protein